MKNFPYSFEDFTSSIGLHSEINVSYKYLRLSRKWHSVLNYIYSLDPIFTLATENNAGLLFRAKLIN